jgi:methyl-accepting chemotaxis protein
MATRSHHLSRRFLIAGVVIAGALTLVLGAVVGRFVRSAVQGVSDRHAAEAAHTAAALTDAYLRELRLTAEMLSRLPAIVDGARTASQGVTARRLDQLSIPDAERQFAATRKLGGDPALDAYLRGLPAQSELVEVFFTESHGYVVLSSERTSDFAQQDEEWWQIAMRDGSYESPVHYDSSARALVMEYDLAIRPTANARPLGVLRTSFGLDSLRGLVRAAEPEDTGAVQLVDELGRVLTSPALVHLPESERPGPAQGAGATTLRGANGDELVASAPANGGRWRAVYRRPVAQAYATARTTERATWAGATGLLALTLGLLLFLGRWLDRQITAPVRAAATVTRQVASGDLALSLSAPRGGSGEMQDLMGSVQTMVEALRRLVGAIRTSADESAAMAAEISAATEQMSASTQEMTSTTQDLTRRAAEQAQLVRASAEDATRILNIASALAMGSEDSVRRNADLAKLARHHKGLLDQSVTQLAKLATEIEHGVQEAEALAASSAQIQRFVTQAKAVATQTNMLALNAAIEAARAGQQGRGFAVVADEVRKLASVAAAAAGETADTVRGVLTRVQTTRDRLQRLAQTGAVAREAAQTAAQGLNSVTGEAEANDAWSQEIAESASEVRRLVDEIAARLAAVAEGTDGLLASAQEIAASSEEQSASTEEIASSANQLAEAADRLQGAVKSFRIVADQSGEAPLPPPSSAPAAPASSDPLSPPALTPEVAT